MSKFKPGDVVRCVKAKEGVLKMGHRYTVERCVQAGVNLIGFNVYCFMTTRFVLDDTFIIDRLLEKYS